MINEKLKILEVTQYQTEKNSNKLKNNIILQWFNYNTMC